VHNGRDQAECSRLQQVISHSSLFKLRVKVLRSLADLQLYDSEFQTEGALTLNALADNASTIRGTVSNNLSDDRSVHAGR